MSERKERGWWWRGKGEGEGEGTPVVRARPSDVRRGRFLLTQLPKAHVTNPATRRRRRQDVSAEMGSSARNSRLELSDIAEMPHSSTK